MGLIISGVKWSPSVFLATGFGIGWVPKAPGTAGSVLGLFLWWLVGFWGLPAYGFFLIVALLVGVLASGRAAQALGLADPPMVVWDEVVGMGVTLCAVPRGLVPFLVGFGLFRAFDILKPEPVARLERLPGGYGIMLDDVAAGLYAALVLHGGLWIARGLQH